MATVRIETLDPDLITTDAGDGAADDLDARRVELLAQIHEQLGAPIDRPVVVPRADGGYEALRHAAVIDAARQRGEAIEVLVVDADAREAAALRLAFTGRAMTKAARCYDAGRLLGILGPGSQHVAPYPVRDVAALLGDSRQTVNEDLKPRAQLLAQEAEKPEADRLAPEAIAAMTRNQVLCELGQISEDERQTRVISAEKQRFGGNVKRVEKDAGPDEVARLIYEQAADPENVMQHLRRRLKEDRAQGSPAAEAADESAAGTVTAEAPQADAGDAPEPEPADTAAAASTGMTDLPAPEDRPATPPGQHQSRKGTNTTPVVEENRENKARDRVARLENGYGYNHVGIAEACGVGPGQISELLSANRRKRAETIVRIENGLDRLERAEGLLKRSPESAAPD